MPDKKIEKYLVFFLFISIAVLFIAISFLSEGYFGEADNVNHYFISRYSWQNPELFFDGWGRPLYTILSSPFAQFGFTGIKFFNIIIALLTLWTGYLTARKLGYTPSVLVILLIAFCPIYLVMVCTAMTEILAGFVLILAVYLFFREKYIGSAIVLSFIYFARAETIIFYPIFMAVYLFKRKYKAIAFLFTGILLFTLIGGLFFKDFLWLIHKFPYPIHSKIYNETGPLLHFFNYRYLIFGLPLEILLVVGILLLLVQLFSKNVQIRKQSFYEFLVILAPFAGFFAMHSVLYWKGLGGSLGYLRVITSVIPLSALLCLKGYSLVDQRLKTFPWIRYVAMAGISLWIISVAFRTYDFPVKLSEEEKVIKTTSVWFQKSVYANVPLSYTDVNLPFFLGANPYDETKYNLIFHPSSIKYVPDNSLFIWDSHFGPNENGIPRDSVIMNHHLKLLKVFEPLKEAPTLGGHKYEVMAFLKLPAGQSSDNIEFLTSMKEEEESAYRLIYADSIDFENHAKKLDSLKLSATLFHSGKHSYRMDKSSEFSPGFVIQCKDLRKGAGKLKIRVSLEIFSPVGLNADQPSLVISLEDAKSSYDYNRSSFRSMNLVVNNWNHVEKEVKLLPIRSGNDQLKVYIYNPDKNVFYIDDLKLEVLEYFEK